MAGTTPNPFKNLIDQALTQATALYQWGYAVPIAPKQFMDNLLEEAKAYGINWPDSASRDTYMQITAATIEYAVFYGQLLTRPMPDNPTEEFAAWYESVHA